jgi:hypothetical protein
MTGLAILQQPTRRNQPRIARMTRIESACIVRVHPRLIKTVPPRLQFHFTRLGTQIDDQIELGGRLLGQTRGREQDRALVRGAPQLAAEMSWF